jgi:hypothetical protein
MGFADLKKQRTFLSKLYKLEQPCECLICNEKFNKNLKLSGHVRSAHDMKIQDYYDKYILDGTNICICGNKKKFISIGAGYNSFCSKKCQYEQISKGGVNYVDRSGRPSPFKGISSGKGRPSKKKGRRNTLTPEQSKNLSEGIKIGLEKSDKNKERVEKGIFKGGRCKLYFIDGHILQGRYELYYFLTNKDKILSVPNKRIKTPFGFYTPDFELKNYFIEIKSTYTITTKMFKKQVKKINWTSENIKKVKILVLDGKLVDSYLGSNKNLVKYLYDKEKHKALYDLINPI